jgi:predicted nucleotidyltransferase
MNTNNEILNKVKEAVYTVDPEAKVILYGSRARGNAKPESDWDFLVLTRMKVDHFLKMTIRHKLYSVELETGEIISSLIHEERIWYSKRLMITPLYKSISEEGMSL